jgi:hypothetical protein
MPRVGDFGVFRDNPVALKPPPQAAGELPPDFHSDLISLPGVDTTLSGVLALRVNPSSNANLTLEIVLNNVLIVPNVRFDTPRDRSWHEVISGASMLASNNRLHIVVHAGGTGTVSISDIVIWFRKNI